MVAACQQLSSGEGVPEVGTAEPAAQGQCRLLEIQQHNPAEAPGAAQRGIGGAGNRWGALRSPVRAGITDRLNAFCRI